ncbi:hypothetical protein Dimus_014749 [Dionaea muscipula]
MGKRQRMLTARAVSPGLGGKEADNLDHLGFYSEDCGPASAFQEIQLVVDLGHYGNTSLRRIRLARIYRTRGGESGEMEGLSGGVSQRSRRNMTSGTSGAEELSPKQGKYGNRPSYRASRVWRRRRRLSRNRSTWWRIPKEKGVERQRFRGERSGGCLESLI